jgi:hypothetical protein
MTVEGDSGGDLDLDGGGDRRLLDAGDLSLNSDRVRVSAPLLRDAAVGNDGELENRLTVNGFTVRSSAEGDSGGGGDPQDLAGGDGERFPDAGDPVRVPTLCDVGGGLTVEPENGLTVIRKTDRKSSEYTDAELATDPNPADNWLTRNRIPVRRPRVPAVLDLRRRRSLSPRRLRLPVVSDLH